MTEQGASSSCWTTILPISRPSISRGELEPRMNERTWLTPFKPSLSFLMLQTQRESAQLQSVSRPDRRLSLTEHFAISEPQNWPFDEFYVVQKLWSTDVAAPKLSVRRLWNLICGTLEQLLDCVFFKPNLKRLYLKEGGGEAGSSWYWPWLSFTLTEMNAHELSWLQIVPKK